MNTDDKLKEALIAQLSFWIGNSASNVQVTVNEGIVTLRGCVSTYAEKIECVEMVKHVGGVKAVTDEVVVKIPEALQRTDGEIATTAANAINWITTVPQNSIKVTSRGGMLILEGTVENQQQKQVVELVARDLPGITGITNLITTKDKLADPGREKTTWKKNSRDDCVLSHSKTQNAASAVSYGP